MQNKTANIIFYSLVIILMILCGIGTLYRYKADIYFDIARNQVPVYARTDKPELMQWAYNNAVRINPLESKNYSYILNGHYLDLIVGEYERRKFQDSQGILP